MFSLRYVGYAVKLIKIAPEHKLVTLNYFGKNFSSNGTTHSRSKNALDAIYTDDAGKR